MLAAHPHRRRRMAANRHSRTRAHQVLTRRVRRAMIHAWMRETSSSYGTWRALRPQAQHATSGPAVASIPSTSDLRHASPLTYALHKPPED
eukprot:1879387-Alexandrium_andersonii.AAC.1